MRKKFFNLPLKTQIIFSTMPIYVSSTLNPDIETDEQILARQKKFSTLTKSIRWKLSYFETGDKIQTIGQKYRFELLRLANITRLIREYYFNEVRFKDFPKEIEKRTGVSLLTAQEITRYIKSEIIDWDPWAEYLEKLPKASAREILTKFPKVAEQKITDGYLEFKNQPGEIFDPTIRNWLQDYIQHLGQERHSNIQRMDFLFHTENTKNLSSTEREKLGIILKSFDENIPLPIDVENNEIVFDISEKPTVPQKSFPPGGVITERPVFKDQEASSKARPFFSSSISVNNKIGVSQGQTLSNSSKSNFIQTQKSASKNFTRPYSTFAKVSADKTITAAPTPKLIQKKTPDTIQFINPYPKPETHKVEPLTEIAGTAPVKLKGFSEGIMKKSVPPASRLTENAANETKSYTLRHPKNIIYPHYGIKREEKPEPRIDGNIVDLSGN